MKNKFSSNGFSYTMQLFLCTGSWIVVNDVCAESTNFDHKKYILFVHKIIFIGLLQRVANDFHAISISVA